MHPMTPYWRAVRDAFAALRLPASFQYLTADHWRILARRARAFADACDAVAEQQEKPR